MSYHSGTIHTVRFSSNGRFLASGADDKIVCVYTLDPTPPSHTSFGKVGTFGASYGQCSPLWTGTSEAAPVENWRIFRRLIGHDNDVQDLGWSYDSSILVSVGLDSKVVVWSGHTFEKLKSISSHMSHVKGLTFDPANKYFATASDDRTIKVFRFTPPGPNSSAHDQMNNFMLEKTISAPFAASPLTTYFRRCSWSPDGNHIAAANAVNGPVSSVAIINRGSWDGDIHLIGHEGPVEVCAFSPRLFSKQPIETLPKGANGQLLPQFVTVIACAGQDKALSVWITSNPRPLVITQDLAVKSISDLAWSPDGRNLFVTSLDGSIVTVMFGETDLGYSVSLDENERALSKFGAGRRGAGIVEGPSALLLEEKSKEGEMRGAEGRMGALMGDLTKSSDALTNGNGASVRPTNVPSNGHSNTTDIRNGHNNSIKSEELKSNAKPTEATDPHAAELERLKSRITITKEGKKRIAPLTVSSFSSGESSLPRSQLMSSSSHNQNGANDMAQTILDLSKPFDGLPKGGLPGLLLGNKRKLVIEEGDVEGHTGKRIASASRNGAVPILSTTMNGTTLTQPQSSVSGQITTPEYIRPAVTNPSLTVSQLRLGVPKVRAQISRPLGNVVNNTNGIIQDVTPSESSGVASKSVQADVMFEVRNPTAVAAIGRFEDRDPSRLSVTKKGQPVWQDFLPRSVLLLTGGQHFWAAACEDGSIYAWTPAGRRLVSPLIMESQPVILESLNWWLLCVSAVGMCYVWDIRTMSSPHPPVSLAPILDIATHTPQGHLTKAPAITSARLNSEGRIVITLTNGDGFAYSPLLYVWQRLSEVWWAIGSQYWNSTDSSVGNLKQSTVQTSGNLSNTNLSAGVIPYLEKSTTNETLVRGRAYSLQRLVKQLLSREGFEGLESHVSVAHLENRMAAAMMLGAKVEFQMYLYMYAKRLGAEGLKLKVDELLRVLVGGMFEDISDANEGTNESLRLASSVGRTWSNATDMLCGWPRQELLKGVILILGWFVFSRLSALPINIHRKTSRLTTHYCTIRKIAWSHRRSTK